MQREWEQQGFGDWKTAQQLTVSLRRQNLEPTVQGLTGSAFRCRPPLPLQGGYFVPLEVGAEVRGLAESCTGAAGGAAETARPLARVLCYAHGQGKPSVGGSSAAVVRLSECRRWPGVVEQHMCHASRSAETKKQQQEQQSEPRVGRNSMSWQLKIMKSFHNGSCSG